MQGNVLGSRAGRRLIALLAVAVALVTAAAMLVAPAPAVAAEQRDVLEGLPVSFAVSGQPKGDAEFSATLTPKSADAPMPAAGGEVAARKGAGDASFGQIEVTVPGVWEYEVRQTTKLDGSRWTLDPTVYHVEVVAEWHDGKFDAVYKVYSDPSKPGDKKEKVAFTNTYIADGSWQVDPGEKWFENGELKGGDFTFDIFRREGDDWVKVAETTNGAGVEKTADGKKYSVGSWAFEGIALTQPGDYEYKVLERLPEGADASDGFKLDGDGRGCWRRVRGDQRGVPRRRRQARGRGEVQQLQGPGEAERHAGQAEARPADRGRQAAGQDRRRQLGPCRVQRHPAGRGRRVRGRELLRKRNA